MSPRLVEVLRTKIDEVTSLPKSIVGFAALTFLSIGINFKDFADLKSQFGSTSNLLKLLSTQDAPLLLIGVTIIWYYRYKYTTIHELALIGDTFEEERAPAGIGSLDSRWMVPLLGHAIVVAFCALVLLAPHLWLYCILVLALHAFDLIGSAKVLQNLNKFFTMFPLSDHDSKTKFMQQRRAVLKAYYFENPTLQRIVVTFIITASLLVFAIQISNPTNVIVYILYGTMIGNIAISETIMSVWRARRDGALNDIDRAETDERSRLSA